MKEYEIKFEGRCNAININQLSNTALFPLFKNYDGKIVDMYRLVATLNNSKFKVFEIINNPNNTVYRLSSEQMNSVIKISLSKDIDYQRRNKKMYDMVINILKNISTNAKVTNNNIMNISNFQTNDTLNQTYKPNLKTIKGTMYKPSIRKALKTKKGKIVLCTILGFTIVAGSFIAHTVSERLEAQKVIEQNKQYSYQVDQSSDNINQEREMYQAIQDGTIDDSLASPNKELEEIKIEQNQQYYNEQNYQRLR